jgi:hypothetical protein
MDLENPGHLAGLRALVFGGSAVIGYLVGHSRQSRAINHTEELPAKVLNVADPCDAYRFNDYLRPQVCETIADRLDLRPAFYAQESDESLCYRDGPGDFYYKTDASLATTSPLDTHTLVAPSISPNFYVEEHQYRAPSIATKLRQVLVIGFLMVALTILALYPPLLRLEVVLSIFLLIVLSWYLYQLVLYLYKEMRAKLWKPKTAKDQPTGREVVREGELEKVEGQLEGAVEKVAGRLVGEAKKHVQYLRLDHEEKFEAQTKAMAELEVAVENASFRNFEDHQVSTICNRTARELKDVQADLQLVDTKAVLLESKIDVNSTSVVQLGTVVNANSTNMSQLRTDVDANKINVRQLQNDVKTIVADMNDPEGKVGRISTKVSKLRTDFMASSEDMTNFKKSVEGMEGRLLTKVGGELDKKVRIRSREEVTAQVRVVKERQTRLDDALGRHLRLIDGVETSTSKLQEGVRDIKERQEELNQQFKQVGSVGTTASDLQISLKAVEGGQAEIKKALGGQLERTEQVSTVADELQKGFKDLKNGVDAQLADQLEQVDGKVEAIVSPLQENLKAVEDRQAKLEVLGNQLKQVDKKVDASVSPLRDNLTTLEIRVGEQFNRIVGVETSVSHLQEKFEVFGGRLDTQLGDRLSQKVADQVREEVNLQVKAIGDQLRSEFAEQVRLQVHEQVEQQVRERITALEQVNTQLHGEIEKQVQERVETETKAIEGRLRVELRNAFQHVHERITNQADKQFNEKNGLRDFINERLHSVQTTLQNEVTTLDSKIGEVDSEVNRISGIADLCQEDVNALYNLNRRLVEHDERIEGVERRGHDHDRDLALVTGEVDRTMNGSMDGVIKEAMGGPNGPSADNGFPNSLDHSSEAQPSVEAQSAMQGPINPADDPDLGSDESRNRIHPAPDLDFDVNNYDWDVKDFNPYDLNAFLAANPPNQPNPIPNDNSGAVPVENGEFSAQQHSPSRKRAALPLDQQADSSDEQDYTFPAKPNRKIAVPRKNTVPRKVAMLETDVVPETSGQASAAPNFMRFSPAEWEDLFNGKLESKDD